MVIPSDLQVKQLEEHNFQEVHCDAITCRFNSYNIESKPDRGGLSICTRKRGLMLIRRIKVEFFPPGEITDIKGNWLSDPIPICVSYRSVKKSNY